MRLVTFTTTPSVKFTSNASPSAATSAICVRILRTQIAEVAALLPEQLATYAKEIGAPLDLVRYVAKNKALPVVNFAAGGVATPADAALMMQLGADGVFVGSGIFKSADPKLRAEAIVKAVAYYGDPAILAGVSYGLGKAMDGIELSALSDAERLAKRGW